MGGGKGEGWRGSGWKLKRLAGVRGHGGSPQYVIDNGSDLEFPPPSKKCFLAVPFVPSTAFFRRPHSGMRTHGHCRTRDSTWRQQPSPPAPRSRSPSRGTTNRSTLYAPG